MLKKGLYKISLFFPPLTSALQQRQKFLLQSFIIKPHFNLFP